MSAVNLPKAQSGIDPEKLDNFTEKQTAVIYEQLSRRELSKEQLAEIMKKSPDFVGGFVETVKDINRTAAGLTDAHKQALGSLNIVESFVAPLNVLAKGCRTTEERIAIAGNIQNVVFKICDTADAIYKEHNRAAQELKKDLGFLALALLAASLLGARR